MSNRGRIVGGSNIVIEEAPYQVLLLKAQTPFCGGTIISKEWIVTAAHCMARASNNMVIRAGSSYSKRGGSTHGIRETIIHEGFHVNGYGVNVDDICLVRLNTPLSLDSTRRPIAMFGRWERIWPGAFGVVSGWGNLEERGSSSEVLRMVQVPVLSKRFCNRAYSFLQGITVGQICAGFSEGGKDACQGDSGGPLVVGGRLAGVVSWGKGCGRRRLPGVYSEIAYYRDWIKQKSGV
ncbi:trypsin-1-like [Orussus abietinus]|uniref:trypsin-1-like n=1 Tax=Orussus abietinus TaxID=222816 RepID=UPI00062680DA|nr:trypsin-1-like [Orussus abietinus]